MAETNCPVCGRSFVREAAVQIFCSQECYVAHLEGRRRSLEEGRLRRVEEDSKSDRITDESWSKGRLAQETLSRGAGSQEQAFIHEYLRACAIENFKSWGVGQGQEVASPYPAQEIEAHLNKRDAEGWRLVSMEPHWWYEQQAISGAMSITRPLAIVGWYLTFEKRR